MGYWDEAPVPRDQILLIPMTLVDRIPDDHPVRLFYEILASLDWAAWEQHYCGVAGQPPIPPMVVAGAILYGMSHGIRSSRRLEWACGHAVDFIWLVEGRHMDHSTFCNFRTRFDRELAELADLKKRQAALSKALAAARAVDAKRQQRKDAPKKAAKVPVADPDSAILPNKEGGHAPNHTPVAAVDGHDGFIVDCDVIGASASEADTVIPTVERIEENLGAVPQQFLADTAFATGQNLTDLQERGIETVMPVDQARLNEQNPAVRADPTQAVAEAGWPKLPRNPQSKKLDKAAFV